MELFNDIKGGGDELGWGLLVFYCYWLFCDFLFMFNDKKLNFKFVVIEKFFIKDIYIIYKIWVINEFWVIKNMYM